jgi:tetratricopeptide (TPR) repeat protein
MTGLRSGSWRFSAQAIGFTPQSGTLDVPTAPAATPPVTITLRKAALPPAAASALAAKDIQAQLAIADQLFDAKMWDEAIAVYRAVLSSVPISAAYLQIGAAYRNKGQLDLAVGAYNELLKRDPNNERAKIGIALATLDNGDSESAEKALESLARLPSASAEVFYTLGEARRARSKPSEAANAYKRAIQLDPFWGKPVFAMGRLAMDQGDTASATKYFQQTIDVAPVSAEAAEAATILEQLRK